MQYRAEIDGLRAVAVIPVILFHAGFETFSGGFVGVDVFFVISGYLITTIILADMDAGAFSLANFYDRRARRILPALLFITAVCIPFAWRLLLPNDMENFTQSLVAVATFSSNILFWLQSGYFDTAAEFKPLLHTWSLAVEEQYYVLFPLFLMLTWKLGKGWIAAILALIALLSLGMAQWGSIYTPSAAFYLLPARGWELLVGSFVAFFLLNKKAVKGNQWLSLLGLLMILYAVFVFDEQTPFPSFYTLIPVIGVALIILFASPDTVAHRLLSNKGLVGIGLISYSAYLWHQPLFVFARYASPTEPSALLFAALSLMTFLLAYLTWRMVEQPFRARHKIDTKTLVPVLSIGMVGVLAIGLAGHVSEGYRNQRFANDDLARLNSAKRSEASRCRFGDCGLAHAKEEDFLLIGDSNAYHFSAPLDELMAKNGLQLFNLALAGCAPLKGVIRKDESRGFNKNCSAHVEDVKRFAINQDAPQNIIISAAWGLYVYGSDYAYPAYFEPFNDPRLFPMDNLQLGEKERVATVLATIKNAIERLAATGKNVYVVYPMPYMRHEFSHNKQGFLAGVAPYDYNVFFEANKTIIKLFDELTALPNVFAIKPHEKLCFGSVQGTCLTEINGLFLYGDRLHMSDYGARYVFEDFFKKAIRRSGSAAVERERHGLL